MSRRLPVLLYVAALGGCGEPTLLLPPQPVVPPPPATTHFDPSRVGTVTGHVAWPGELPAAPTYLYGVPDAAGNFTTHTFTGPNQPRIDPDTRAVAGAIVFLRGVDPAVARPWDHPPVRVELVERGIRVRQGAEVGRVGFVRRGDAVELVSRDPVYHVLRGRGAAFFSLALPEREQVRTRTFTDPGRVELSSGAGYYWASADLFVTDHPYWTTTDAAGRFTLSGVPAGRVEVVVWHPGWLPARRDRDPETGLVTRMTYAPATEQARPADVPAGGTSDIGVTLP
ncbi:carboxypeptidase regulatory-like domain-containing protein [bacterium]|nr:carboxypeptidase regulatory-like domain-containing protein [bacterium]